MWWTDGWNKGGQSWKDFIRGGFGVNEQVSYSIDLLSLTSKSLLLFSQNAIFQFYSKAIQKKHSRYIKSNPMCFYCRKFFSKVGPYIIYDYGNCLLTWLILSTVCLTESMTWILNANHSHCIIHIHSIFHTSFHPTLPTPFSIKRKFITLSVEMVWKEWILSACLLYWRKNHRTLVSSL